MDAFLIYLVVQVVTGKDTNFILLFFVSGFFVCGFITFLTWKKIFITQTMYVCVIGMSAVSFVILWNEPVVANFYLLFLAIFMMGLYQDYRPVLLMGGIGLLIGGYFYSHFGTRMNYVYREGDFIFFVFTMVVTLVVTLLKVRFSVQKARNNHKGTQMDEDEETWRKGIRERFEVTIQKGNETYIYDMIKIPIFGLKGERKFLCGIGYDITEKRKAEEFMRKSDKLAVVGELAAGIAHEVRNPLTAIKGFIQLMAQNEKEGTNRHYYNIISAEIDRINFIVSELLVLAKPQVSNVQLHDMNLQLKHVITLLESQASMNNVQIVVTGWAEMATVRCEVNSIKQAFINIIKNALEAMPAGGILTIESTIGESGCLLIRFTDNGPGIPEEMMKKLGEPFYTTKEKGTGLGLTVTYRIIEQHNGTIEFFSEVGSGTTVEITLPLTESS